jgi:hypothetical protein
MVLSKEGLFNHLSVSNLENLDIEKLLKAGDAKLEKEFEAKKRDCNRENVPSRCDPHSSWCSCLLWT